MLNQLLFEIVDELHPDELPMFNPSWGFHPQLCHKRLFHDDVLVGFLWFILAYIAMNLHLIIIIHALWLNEKSWYNLPFVLLTFLALLQFLNSKRKNCVLLGNKFLCWSCCCCREPNHHVDFGVGWLLLVHTKNSCQNQIIVGFFIFFKKPIIIFIFLNS
jgi:hypothetical protein